MNESLSSFCDLLDLAQDYKRSMRTTFGSVLGLSAGVLTVEAAVETWREGKRKRKIGLSLLLGEAARRLGVSRKTLERKLKAWASEHGV